MNSHLCIHLRKLEMYFSLFWKCILLIRTLIFYTHTFFLFHILFCFYIEIKYVSGHIDKIIIYNKQVKL